MQMNDKEIIKSYSQAPDKRYQIGVLSELNDCDKSEICEILKNNGIVPPKMKGHYSKNTKNAEPVIEKPQLADGVLEVPDIPDIVVPKLAIQAIKDKIKDINKDREEYIRMRDERKKAYEEAQAVLDEADSGRKELINFLNQYGG